MVFSAESKGFEKVNFNERTSMLGEKIGEISGKVTMQRVLPNLGGYPKMETSFQASGSVLGTNVKDTGTYWTVVRPDGTQYGEGQGVMMTKDGKVATWTGHGVGVMKKDGTATYRGALYFQTMPPKLSTQKAIHTPNTGNGNNTRSAIVVGRGCIDACGALRGQTPAQPMLSDLDRHVRRKNVRLLLRTFV